MNSEPNEAKTTLEVVEDTAETPDATPLETPPDPENTGGKGGGLRKVFWIAAFALILLAVAALGTTGYLGQRELRDRVAALEGELAVAQQSLNLESAALASERSRADGLQSTMGRVNELSNELAVSLAELQTLTGSPPPILEDAEAAAEGAAPSPNATAGDEGDAGLDAAQVEATGGIFEELREPADEVFDTSDEATAVEAPAEELEAGALEGDDLGAQTPPTLDEAFETASEAVPDQEATAETPGEGIVAEAEEAVADPGEIAGEALSLETVVERVQENTASVAGDVPDETATEVVDAMPSILDGSSDALAPDDLASSIGDAGRDEDLSAEIEAVAIEGAAAPAPELPAVSASAGDGEGAAEPVSPATAPPLPSWWERFLERVRSLAPSE